MNLYKGCFKIIPDVDIYTYPLELKQFATTTKQTQLTIGDLHGNAIKLIHFLISEKVLNVNEQDFSQLIAIYKKSRMGLTVSEINLYDQILAKASCNPVGLIRLLGDELADRGHNDYLTLLVFREMHEKHIAYEILFSNHGLAFLESFESENPLELRYDLGYMQAASWYNLKAIIGKIVSREHIEELVEKYYKPFLKIISYSVNKSDQKPKLRIYTHAPIGMETIRAMANLYGVPYVAENITSLCHVIDKINQAFKNDIRQKALLKRQEFLQGNIMYFPLGAVAVPPEAPLLRIVWNRAIADNYLDTKTPSSLFDIEFIHGHEGPQLGLGNIEYVRGNMKNLDATLLGKQNIHQGPYIICVETASS